MNRVASAPLYEYASFFAHLRASVNSKSGLAPRGAIVLSSFGSILFPEWFKSIYSCNSIRFQNLTGMRFEESSEASNVFEIRKLHGLGNRKGTRKRYSAETPLPQEKKHLQQVRKTGLPRGKGNEISGFSPGENPAGSGPQSVV
jgi:hypothetical protein